MRRRSVHGRERALSPAWSASGGTFAPRRLTPISCSRSPSSCCYGRSPTTS